MNIIQGHIKKISKPVQKWSDIKDAVKDMKKAIDKGDFAGMYQEAVAISHCQVSEDPYTFFILHRTFAKGFNGHRVIVNPKITYKSLLTTFKEACMSFQHRPQVNVRRYDKIIVECLVKVPIVGLKRIVLELEGLEAYIVQHEVDHFNGIDIYNK